VCAFALFVAAPARAQLDAPTVPPTSTVVPITAVTVPATTSTTRSTAPVATVPDPIRLPTRVGELTDTAGIIPPRNEQAITDELVASKARAGARLEVLTIRSLKDWDAETYGLDAFASAAFDAWNLGDPIRHDGALVVIVMEPSRSLVVTGPWYQHSADAEINSVVDSTLTPALAKREYTRGIRESVQAIARILSLSVPEPTTSTLADPTGNGERKTSLLDVPAWTSGLLGGPLVLGAGWALRRRRRPQLTCPQCGNRAQHTPGPVHEDVTVDGGEPVGPWLDSVGLRLIPCIVCGHYVVERRPKHRGTCGSCASPLPPATLTNLRGATSDEPGSVKVSRACNACDYRQDRVLSLPRLSQGGRVGASHLRE
jgi:uncharacterized membrane protein YgcG